MENGFVIFLPSLSPVKNKKVCTLLLRSDMPSGHSGNTKRKSMFPISIFPALLILKAEQDSDFCLLPQSQVFYLIKRKSKQSILF